MLNEEHTKKIGKGFGIITWILFVVTILASISFTLSAETDSEFKRTMTYIVVFTMPFLALLALSKLTDFGSRLKSDEDNNVLFFMKDPTIYDLALIPIGIVVILHVSELFSLSGNNFGNLVTASLILGGLLYITRSIIVPILIHGLYNIIVLLDEIRFFADERILSTDLPIRVIFESGNTDLLSAIFEESAFQLFMVAVGEEMLRVLLIVPFLLLYRGGISQKKIQFAIGVVFSGIVWALLHAFQNNIQIPFF